MNDVLIVGGVLTAILVYLVVTHKISIEALKADLAAAKDKLDQIIHRNTANDAASVVATPAVAPTVVIDHAAIIQAAASVVAAAQAPLQVAPPATAQAGNPFMAYGETPELDAARAAQAAASNAANASAGTPNTDATFLPPINGPYYLRDIPNAMGSVTSPSFPMKAGTYRVGLTEGLTRGQGYATLDGVGRLTGSTVAVPNDGNYTITMVADPGNSAAPGGGGRFCVQFWT